MICQLKVISKISLETYLRICEQLEEEPDPERMPIDESMFPVEVQFSFLLHSLLPERWDGMSGSYLGKDWSALGTLLDVYDIEHRKVVTYFLKYIDIFNANGINDRLEKKRDKTPQAAEGGIHVQG